jgi:AbrB family looped-hinge helix DNA binding protein
MSDVLQKILTISVFCSTKEEFMATVIISPKGQVVIPANIRNRYGLVPGKRMEILDFGNHIVLVPLAEEPIKAAKGMVRFPRG